MAKGALKAVVAMQFDDTGLKKAQKGIKGFASSLKGALGALGVATSFSAIVSQLELAAKAAVADTKAQALLANQMRNTVQASDGQIASTEAFIQKLQLQTSILDDQLRPAMSSLVRATGDVAKAQDLLAVATDVSAATGKDLESVALALGKAHSGQTTALFRMIPGLKGSSDWLAKLKANTAGAAQAAANTDPFTKMNVVFNDMQEAIGMALIPAMQNLANYFASEEFQSGFTAVAVEFANLVTGIEVVASAVGDGIDFMNTKLKELQLDGAFTDILSRIVNAIPIVGQLINTYKTLVGIGAAENAKANLPDETSRLIRRRLESLGVIGAPDDPGPKSPTKKLTEENKALTDAVNKAKAAFEAKVKAYQEAVQAAQQIIDSTKEMTASFTALFKVTPKMGEFESKTVDAFQNIFDTINDALDKNRILPKAAASLTAYATSTINAMKAIAKQQDVLAGKIDVARTITAGVTGLAQITGMLETTTESVVTSTRTIAGGIETIITKTADVTKSGGLVDNFQKLVDKTKAFAKNLIDLKKMGLNKNLFAQLVNAGADAGGATAQAIVDGGSETISALNDLYGQLDLTAAQIAENTTDVMYEVGQQIITNGFIEGLVSQADALAQAAEAMANSFAAAFNAQLQSALQVALPAMPVQAPTDVLSGRPDPKRSPQRYAAWLAGIGGIDPLRSPQAYAAKQATYNVTVNAGLGTNGTNVAQEIVSTIKQYERANGNVWVAA